MKFKRLGDTYVVRLNKDEDIVGSISELCKVEGIKLATLSAIAPLTMSRLGTTMFQRRNTSKMR